VQVEGIEERGVVPRKSESVRNVGDFLRVAVDHEGPLLGLEVVEERAEP